MVERVPSCKVTLVHLPSRVELQTMISLILGPFLHPFHCITVFFIKTPPRKLRFHVLSVIDEHHYWTAAKFKEPLYVASQYVA